MPRGPSPELLLIDISNSFTKFAHATRDALRRVSRIPTPDLTRQSFARMARPGQKIVLSSVVPAKARLALEAFAPQAAAGHLLIVSAKLNLGAGIDYPRPSSIGADRLANAAAVRRLYGAPAVVVDFGTAVTFDIISPEGNYIGGVIAPGLEAMTDYLFQRTALLPRIRPAEPKSAIGKSTRAAMLAGAVYGYRGLVREILTQVRRELATRKPLRVIATGGYAALISSRLPEISSVHPHLTLEGLRIIANLNFPP
ncbi:MAG: type III pantothenate kinase [Chthoniobacteraceae bacterium]|jgi:type III pantothenate kinase